MQLDIPVIDAEAFPLYVQVPDGSLMLLQPVAADAVEGLEEAYSEAVWDGEAALRSTGVHIDAHWRVAPDHSHVVLVLNGRIPRPFKLGVRYAVEDGRDRGFFLDLARHDTGPVGIFIYRSKEDVVRAAASLNRVHEGDRLFFSLGIGVEPDLYCRPLLRLARTPAV